MKRYQHYWYPERGKYYPTRIAVLDVDYGALAKDRRPAAKKGARAVYSLRWANLLRGRPESSGALACKGNDAVWTALGRFVKSRETTWLFLPNAILVLDHLDFWRRLEERQVEPCGKDWRVDRGAGRVGEDRSEGLMVLDGPPVVISCRPAGARGKLLILDTQNLGFDLLGEDYDSPGRCDRYLQGVLACLSTLRENSSASLRCTAASQAVSCLRADDDVRCLHCHVNPDAARVERGCDLSGWCQVFRHGVIPGPVYHLDVRSMYASIYRTLPVPVSLRRFYDGADVARQHRPGNPGDCTAYVRLRLRDSGQGHRHRGRPNDGTGEHTAYLAGRELHELHRGGEVRAYLAWCEYTCRPVLADFAERWLSALAVARQEGDRLVQQWVKRLLVSLCGKFGETGKRWIGVPAVTERDSYSRWEGAGPDGKPAMYRNIAGWTQRREIYGESYHSIPAITAFITAAGRCQLRSYVDTAGRSNVWYVDTDGLLCNHEGYASLLSAGCIREGEVGHLRLCGIHSRCTIHDARHYELDDTVRCAGVPRGKIDPGQTRQEWWQGPRAGEGIHKPVWAKGG